MGLKLRRKVAKKGLESLRGIEPPRRVTIPPQPTYTQKEDHSLSDEQQVARTEILMTKGVRDRRQLMALLDVQSPITMDRYIARVYARWELTGTSAQFARHRGEGLRRLDLIEAELWASISNNEDDRIKMVALKNLIDVQGQRAALIGLTPKVVERLASAEGAEVQGFTQRIESHEKMSRLAGRMLQLMQERTGMKLIDAKPVPEVQAADG